MANTEQLWQKLIEWRTNHVSDKRFMYALSIVIGLLSGAIAVVVKNAVYFVQMFLKSAPSWEHNYLFFVYPPVGILIVILLLRFVFKNSPGHGIPNMLYAISKGNGNLSKKGMFDSIVTASITVGFGGSVGLEGPTAGTSGTISSRIGQLLRLNYRKKKMLIGAAASGALAAIFNAPIAAIVFALEVIMLDLSLTSLIPLLLTSVSAALMSRLFLHDDFLFHFKFIDEVPVADMGLFVLLGLFTGLLSVLFTSTFFWTDNKMKTIQSPYTRVLLGGTLIGGLIYLFPQLYGEGYTTINALIANDIEGALSDISFVSFSDSQIIALVLLLLLPFLKSLAASLTISSGGVGGIFAPTLFIGSSGGFVFGYLLELMGMGSARSNFTLVGMAGAMAGILQAPLTAIFLIAEITGGYTLFLPLMITSVISFMVTRYFVPYSVYTRQLSEKGELITHHKDKAVLTLMRLQNEIETNFSPIGPYDKLGDLVQVIATSSRNLFPVIGENNVFLGVVDLNDIRQIMFNKDKYETTVVHELMLPAPEYIHITDTMEAVMNKFDQSGAWNLPVVSNSNEYIGFVSKSKLFSAYRSLLRDFYEEED
jgi:CIC family chloride channel protein